MMWGTKIKTEIGDQKKCLGKDTVFLRIENFLTAIMKIDYQAR